MLLCIVVLCCRMLHCISVSRLGSYCNALSYLVVYCIVLLCNVSCCVVVHLVVLYAIVLFRVVLIEWSC